MFVIHRFAQIKDTDPRKSAVETIPAGLLRGTAP